MNSQVFRKAVEMAERRQHVLISTVDAAGVPHIASAGSFFTEPDGRIIVGEMGCPATMANIQQNPRISILAWDIAVDAGYQLLGEVESVMDWEELEDLDPAFSKELHVRVQSVLPFSHAPHSDMEVETLAGLFSKCEV
jgi:hypothetical protein